MTAGYGMFPRSGIFIPLGASPDRHHSHLLLCLSARSRSGSGTSFCLVIREMQSMVQLNTKISGCATTIQNPLIGYRHIVFPSLAGLKTKPDAEPIGERSASTW